VRARTISPEAFIVKKGKSERFHLLRSSLQEETEIPLDEELTFVLHENLNATFLLDIKVDNNWQYNIAGYLLYDVLLVKSRTLFSADVFPLRPILIPRCV